MFLTRQPTATQIKQFIASQKDHPFTYTEVGATQHQLPAGYTHDHNSIVIGSGRTVFQNAVAALRNWQQFDLGWVKVVPTGVPIKVGAVVAVQAQTFGVWSLSAARVIYVINELDMISRFGFAYGTLPDHVERGEERFQIEWDQNTDVVTYDILAFSRPRHLLVKLSAPLARQLQKRFARDSLRRMKYAVTTDN
jgi:uncharacterized protein (UPF0548 family)